MVVGRRLRVVGEGGTVLAGDVASGAAWRPFRSSMVDIDRQEIRTVAELESDVRTWGERGGEKEEKG